MPHVTFYEDNRDTTPAPVEMKWSEIAEMVENPTITSCSPCPGKDCKAKYGMAWSPVRLETGTTRANKNVREITVAVFDLDHISEERVVRVLAAIDGFTFALHSTHSHRPSINDGCYRLVMPLSRPVKPNEWAAVLRGAIAHFNLPADPACKDLSRLYFLPSTPKPNEYVFETSIGESVDVDLLLGRAIEDSETANEARFEEPIATEPLKTTELAGLRASIMSVRNRKVHSKDEVELEKGAILSRILDGKALADPGGRDNTVNRAMSIIAGPLITAPWAAVLELVRPAIAAMAIEPEGLTYWLDRARYSFERSVERMKTRDAERKTKDDDLRTRLQGFMKDRSKPGVTSELPRTRDEVLRLLLTDKRDQPLSNQVNAETIMQFDPEVGGSIRWNGMANRVEVHGGPFADTHFDVLATRVSIWLHVNYGIMIARGPVEEVILNVARYNAYDPLMDYLNGLKWDGVPRIGNLFFDYFRHNEIETRSDYLRDIGKKWLISAVARALSPGCQVDTVLVVEGPQGICKSSAFRILGAPWFCDTQLVLGDKDSKMLASSNWIIELAELASFRRSEKDGLKAFFSGTHDTFRAPYGRAIGTYPRRCVFVGTTNEESYLNDATGNRRFWPVKCRRVDIEGLMVDRDQLWAEAVHCYKAGERWWVTLEEQLHYDAIVEERMTESPTEASIASWWYAMHPSKRPERMTSNDVAQMALQIPPERINRSVQTEIGYAMKALGFRKTRRMHHGRFAGIYEPTEKLMKAEQNQTRLLSALPRPS